MSIVDTYIDALTQGRCKPIQYSDRGRFKELWSDAWGKLAQGDASSRIVIVWDGAPPGNKLLVPHLTPLDWALAASLGLLNGGIEAGTMHWSLHIVDLSFGAYRTADVWSVQHAASLLDAMPWVRLYGPVQLKRRAYDPRRFVPVIGGEWADVPTMAECQRNRRENIRHDLQRLAETWQGSIQRSDDHHDLNNLIAPILLSREYRQQVEDPSLLAFETKCRWIGAASVDGPDYGRMAQDVQTALGGLPEKDAVRVTLVDDMAERGWGALVKQWLGASPTLTLETSASPKPLVDLLAHRGPDDFRHRDYSRSVWDAAATGPVDEVLIWDLRLFGKGDATSTVDRRAEERRFYSQLIEAIRYCELVGATNLAWPGFSAAELEEVEKWCASGTGEAPEAALTLAPRCMALLSPTTPVILLSSTTRRSVIEKLKPYRNVLTGLEKPRPLGLFVRDLGQLAEQWGTTWEVAAAILDARQRLRQIEVLEQKFQSTISSDDNATGDTPYVEIYLDESELMGQFWVGGVAAIFKSTLDADRFDDLLFESGVCYYDPLVQRSPHPVSIKGKKERGGSSQELLRAKTSFEGDHQSVSLHRFAMRFASPVQGDENEPIRRSGDFLYFQTAATIIELLLYDVLPACLAEKKYTVSVFVGTRQLGKQTARELLRHKRDFGYTSLIGPDSSKALLESVSGNSVLPVLARIMTERPTHSLFDVHRAMGVTLKYERQPDRSPMLPNRFVCRQPGCQEVLVMTEAELRSAVRAGWDPQYQTGVRRYEPRVSASCCAGHHRWVPDYRALHYVADEFVLDKEFEPYATASCVNQGLPSFNQERDDPQLRDLLLACRLHDQGEAILALIRAFTAVSSRSMAGLSPLRQLLLSKLCVANCLLSGSDLLAVANALPRTGRSNRPPRAPGATATGVRAVSDGQERASSSPAVAAARPQVPPVLREPGTATKPDEHDCTITVRADKLPAGIDAAMYAQGTLKLRNAHCEASRKKPGNIVIRFRALQQDAAARDAIRNEQEAKRVIGLAGDAAAWMRWPT